MGASKWEEDDTMMLLPMLFSWHLIANLLIQVLCIFCVFVFLCSYFLFCIYICIFVFVFAAQHIEQYVLSTKAYNSDEHSDAGADDNVFREAGYC